MEAIIGKKIGMTSIFNAEGKNLPCTIVKIDDCVVTQVKTIETDGYNAIQIASGDVKEKHSNKAMMGHFKKSNTGPKAKVLEFRVDEISHKIGDILNAASFEEGDWVDVYANSKGKGFQGVVKRHGFGGVGQATHGQHDRGRAPGSIGASSFPSRVFKGMRMGGQMGNKRIKSINNRVIKILIEENAIVLSGSVPGHIGSTVVIEK